MNNFSDFCDLARLEEKKKKKKEEKPNHLKTPQNQKHRSGINSKTSLWYIKIIIL